MLDLILYKNATRLIFVEIGVDISQDPLCEIGLEGFLVRYIYAFLDGVS